MNTRLQLWSLQRWKEQERLRKRLGYLRNMQAQAQEGLAGMEQWPEPVRTKLQGQIDRLQGEIVRIEAQLSK